MATKKSSAKKKKSVTEKEKVKPEILEPNKYHDPDDEPSWYHYLIVLGVIALIIGGLYIAFEIFDQEPELTGTAKKYVHEHVVGNITYNIEFNHPIDQIENSNVVIEPSKLDILNTIEFIFALDYYNGTDNGYVAISSTKLANFFRVIYKFTYDIDENFKEFGNFTCLNATKQNKVLTFDPYAQEAGVFLTTEGNCLEVRARNAQEMLLVSDALIWEMIRE